MEKSTLNLHQIVESATVYDLGQPMETNMPLPASHPGFHLALLHRHGDIVFPDGSSGARDLIVTSPHTGTHIDALAHISCQGKLFGGVDAYEAQQGGRFKKHGIDQAGVFFCRGILLDVAKVHGVSMLEAAHGIDAEDLRCAANLAGVEPGLGDAVLIRSGWANHWTDSEAYQGEMKGVPGVNVSGAELIAEWGACLTGHDSYAYEQVRPLEDGSRFIGVHRILLVEKGIYILENLNLEQLAEDQVYEFLLVVTPLKLVGATGSPVRPIALAFE